MPSLPPDGRSQVASQEPAGLDDDTQVLLDGVRREWLRRLESGEPPSLDEYLGRYPRHADALRRLWEQWQGGSPAEEHSTASAPPTTPSTPRQATALPSLPGFELRGVLGEGGMGTVYRARDVRLDRPRAVKVIRAGPFAGAEARERFRREARAVARLDHPGVVRVFSLGEHDGVPFLCMELLEGGSLQGRLRRGPLDVRAAAELVRQLALAVQHAHDHHVLHRDLKPANVLLTADGTPKVSDFGLAKLLDADDGGTQSGAVMGTPSYMAPEQAEGRLADFGPPTDVYALGAVLYECLTGRPPFRTESRSAPLELVRTQPPPPPRQFRAEVPAELEAICLRCLAKPTHERYATAGELAAELEGWLAGRTPPALPSPPTSRPPRGLRRRPRWVLLPLIALLSVLAVGLGAGLYFNLGDPDRPLRRTQERLRRGEAVELLGPTGRPHWSRWWMGERDAKTLLEPDGSFAVQGWPMTLMELLPDTAGRDRYRLHAEVRHIRTGEHGDVGLYFAGTLHRETQAPVYSFLRVGFNDLHDVKDQWRRLPDELRKKIPEPKANRVELLSHYHSPTEDRPILNLGSYFLNPELFKPSGLPSEGAGKWRSLDVEVSPQWLRILFDGRLVGTADPNRIDESDRGNIRQMQEGAPDSPVLHGLVPKLDLGGGLGLYLYASYASFRNVRVEPLEEPKGAD